MSKLAPEVRVVIYARRSQKHQVSSVETQITEAKRFIEEKGWTLVGIYRDDDKNTGRKEFKKRREFLRLLADAEEGLFDVIVVRDHTRLGGDTSRTMRAIEDVYEAGVCVWYYISREQLRLDTWADKTMFAIVSGHAEGERDGISSRVYEDLKVKSRQPGRNVGGRVYGYTNVPVIPPGSSVKLRTDYAIHPGEGPMVLELFQRRAAGAGLRALAKDFNDKGIPSPRAGMRGTGSWSHSVIGDMLQNERYRGTALYGQKKKTYRAGRKCECHVTLLKLNAPSALS